MMFTKTGNKSPILFQSKIGIMKLHQFGPWTIHHFLPTLNGQMLKLTQTAGVEPLTAWYKQGVEDLIVKENK